MTIAHIFIDEYGTPELDINKQGVTPFFAYVGIVIEENQLQKARDVHAKIIANYFQGTHMKSKNIANNDKGHVKRMNILKELSELNHYVVAILVDKSKIDGKGLTYKQSFLKFFNNLFSKTFTDKYLEFHLYLDKLGWEDTQKSISEYMRKNGCGPTLFAQNSFAFKDDIYEEPLIQIADFYAGCVGKYYCGIFDKNQAMAIHNVIKSYVFVDWFPFEYVNYFGASNFIKNDFNIEISNMAIKTATDYLEKEKDEVGREIVKLFLQETNINPLRHISSGEIKKKISSIGLQIGDPISEIGKLRDKGVFIVSPIGKKGYKFPCNEKEIAEFFDRLSSVVVPYLERGNKLHKILVEQSVGAYNILNKEEYKILNSLMSIVS